jgi:predicted dehydrogenase
MQLLFEEVRRVRVQEHTRRPVRAGIIGPRGIGTVHCAALRAIGVEVVAVAASSPESARAHAARLNVPTAYDDPEQLIRAAEIDAVHICSTNSSHVDYSRAAMAAGKHVICEKPLATSPRDARALARAAEGSGLVHAVCYSYRYFTLPRQMRALCASGKLGRVHMIRGAFLLDEILLQNDALHWMFDPARIGPSLSLADIGVHWWDLVEFVSGQRVLEVVCAKQTVRTTNDFSDDSDAILLRLDGGAIATAAIGQAAPGHIDTLSLELIGTKASAAWDQHTADQLWFAELAKTPETVQRASIDADTLYGSVHELPAGKTEDSTDAFRNMMADIYAPIRGEISADPYPSFEEGARGVDILAAVLRSAAERRWITVGDEGDPQLPGAG